jgi:DNA mismatch repair protein MSH4
MEANLCHSFLLLIFSDLLSTLAPDEILLHGNACQPGSKSLLCRKIETWRDEVEGITRPEIKPVSRAYFDQDRGAEFLRRVSMGQIDNEVLARYTVLGAAFALLKYIETVSSMTFPSASVMLRFIDSNASDFLTIDRRTANGLEILSNARSGDQKNCLFGKIDRTKTVVGARFLRQQLLRPSADVATIKARQEATSYLERNEQVLVSVMEQLKRVPDLDRMLNRLVSMQEGKRDAKVVGGNIKTIIAIKHTMVVMHDLTSALHIDGLESGLGGGGGGGDAANSSGRKIVPDLIDAVTSNLLPPCSDSIMEMITSVLTEGTSFSRSTLGSQHQECFAVNVGTDGLLDVARKTYLQTVEDIYAEAERLTSEYECDIKVHYTQARGYHLKIPGTLSVLPDECFIQCVKSPRFIACTTKEVASFSDRSQESIQEALAITDRITQGLLEWLQGHLADLFALSESVALLDMLVGFADLSLTSPLTWSMPTMRESGPLVIRKGRHPILAELSEEHLKVTVESGAGGERDDAGFVPNDTMMDATSSLHVVSGVNGSGKTTYLKQVALIVILAQIGCYVPADEAFIPVRQRLLSRIGSSDDIENNLSTFLMEMKDAAYICKHSGEKSLVLVDELGRGTANRDGSAIAWGVAEALLATNTNLCLFVTHYPLLLNLSTIYPAVKNVRTSNKINTKFYSTYRSFKQFI